MPQFATILKVEDLYNRCAVLFQDTDINKEYRQTIDLPVDGFQSEAELFDHIATFWPYDFFAKPPKNPPKERHQNAKDSIDDETNISGRVTQGRP